jgi:hypothetical protein
MQPNEPGPLVLDTDIGVVYSSRDFVVCRGRQLITAGCVVPKRAHDIFVDAVLCVAKAQVINARFIQVVKVSEVDYIKG